MRAARLIVSALSATWGVHPFSIWVPIRALGGAFSLEILTSVNRFSAISREKTPGWEQRQT